MRKWLWVTIILCASSLWAGNLTQDLEHADDLSVGDRFIFNIRADFSINRVVVPDTLTNFKVFSVERQNKQGITPWFRLTIAPILPGYHTFPSLRVEPVRPDGKDYWTDRFRINVIPTRAEGDTTLVDIKPLQKYPYQFPAWLYAGLLLGVLALLAAYILLRPSKKMPQEQQATQPVVPQKPKQAWEIALEQLRKLIEQNLTARGELVLHHYWLSMILREFLERRYRFAAKEMTSSEIHIALGRLQIDRSPQILEFLLFCDRVKFSKYVPLPDTVAENHAWLEAYLVNIGIADSQPADLKVSDGVAIR